MRYLVLFFALISLILSGCILNGSADNGERMLVVKSGKVDSVKSPGERVTDLGAYSSGVIIDVRDKTTDWDDPDLVTRDEQPIGLSLTLVYARSSDASTLTDMYENNPQVAKDDEELVKYVRRQIAGVAKNITVQFTLSQMLGTEDLDEGQLKRISDNLNIPIEQLQNIAGRELASTLIEIKLAGELSDFGISVRDVEITNITASPEYMALLEQTGNEKKRQDKLLEERQTQQVADENERQQLENQQAIEQQQLANDKAKAEAVLGIEEVNTKIELEKANRRVQAMILEASVYQNNPVYAQVAMYQAMMNALNNAGAVYLPMDSNIWFNQPNIPVTNP